MATYNEIFWEYPAVIQFINDHPDLAQLLKHWPLDRIFNDLKTSLEFQAFSRKKQEEGLKQFLLLLCRTSLQEIAKYLNIAISTLRSNLSKIAYRWLEDLKIYHVDQGKLPESSRPRERERFHNSAQWLAEVYLQPVGTRNPILDRSVDSTIPTELQENIILQFVKDAQTKQKQRGEETKDIDLSSAFDVFDSKSDTLDPIRLIDCYFAIVKNNPPCYSGLIRIGKVYFNLRHYVGVIKFCDFILKSHTGVDTRCSALILLSKTLREIAKQPYRKQDVENALRVITEARSLQSIKGGTYNILPAYNAFSICQEFASKDPEFAQEAIRQWLFFLDVFTSYESESNFQDYRHEILEEITTFLSDETLDPWLRQQLNAFIQRHQNPDEGLNL